jgi:hypothetical protein
LKKENVREYLEGAAADQVVFAIQLSILNRMSFLEGFAELGRLAVLTVLAPSLQLPKRGIRHTSTSHKSRTITLPILRLGLARC